MKTLLLPAALMLLLAACNPQEPVPRPGVGAVKKPTGISQLSIVSWGQRSTPAGVAFNVQADGHSGVSFRLNRPAPPAAFKVTLGGKPLSGVVASGVTITATIPPEYLAEPGIYPVVVELQPVGTLIEAGDFEVVQP
ncbi:MAG: hypothetical protein M3Q40_00610 [Pseudomonadota bacterium]|nr:hypothetical protein [Pseudomonadota bacterium]